MRSWATAFRGQPDLNGVAAVYDELLAKGVQFPEGGDSAAAPIITPQRVRRDGTRGGGEGTEKGWRGYGEGREGYIYYRADGEGTERDGEGMETGRRGVERETEGSTEGDGGDREGPEK